MTALDFLPWRLAGRREFVAAGFLQFVRARAFSSAASDQHVGGALLEIDAHLVAGLQDGETATRRRFGRGVEDRGRAGRAGLAAIADAGQRTRCPFDEIVRRRAC
jgi:hypothetical protein